MTLLQQVRVHIKSM